MENISLVETELIDEKIQKVLRQTNYSEEEAREKLKENDFDEIKIIKSYLGIIEKKQSKITSINQEIYKQLRYKMDDSMNNYREKQNDTLSNKNN
jgi:hypothetical protein